MILKSEREVNNYHHFYVDILRLHNDIEKWRITELQIQILSYFLRFGYSRYTKDLVKDNLNISENVLKSNLSYLRKGRIGRRPIKKLLIMSEENNHISELSPELLRIKEFVESEGDNKIIYFKYNMVSNTEEDSNLKALMENGD